SCRGARGTRARGGEKTDRRLGSTFPSILPFFPTPEAWARHSTALKRSVSLGPLFRVGNRTDCPALLIFPTPEAWARHSTALKRSVSLGPLFRVGNRTDCPALLIFPTPEAWARHSTALKRSVSLGPLFRVGTSAVSYRARSLEWE